MSRCETSCLRYSIAGVNNMKTEIRQKRTLKGVDGLNVDCMSVDGVPLPNIADTIIQRSTFGLGSAIHPLYMHRKNGEGVYLIAVIFDR